MGLLDGDMSGMPYGNQVMGPLQSFGAALMANSGPSRLPVPLLSAIGRSMQEGQQFNLLGGKEAATTGLLGQEYQQKDLANRMMLERWNMIQRILGGMGAGGNNPQDQTQPGMPQGGQGDSSSAIGSTGGSPTSSPLLGGPQASQAGAPSLLGGSPQGAPQGGGAPSLLGGGVPSDLMARSIIADMLIPGAGKEMIASGIPKANVDLRPGGAALLFNPQTGKYEPSYQQPVLPPNTVMNNGQAVPVPGGDTRLATTEGIKQGAEGAREKDVKSFEKWLEFGSLGAGGGANAWGGQPVIPPAASPSVMVKSEQGTNVPPVSQQAPIGTESAYLKERIPQWAKTENAWSDALPSNMIGEQRALAIADALKRTESGSFATEKGNIKAGLHAAGIDLPDDVFGNPAEVQKALKDNFASTLATIKSFSSRPAAAEVILGQKNFANPDLQPEANLSIISQQVGTLRWERALMNDWAQAKQQGWRDPQDFQRAWAKANPIQGFVDQAQKEIGPLKGMPGGPGGAPSAASAPVSKLKTPPSDADLRNTAIKYGISVDEVKKRLGIQ